MAVDLYVNLRHDKIFSLEHGTFSFKFELLLDIFPHSVFEFDVFFSFIKKYYWKNWTFESFQLTVLKTCNIARREIQIVDGASSAKTGNFEANFPISNTSYQAILTPFLSLIGKNRTKHHKFHHIKRADASIKIFFQRFPT